MVIILLRKGNIIRNQLSLKPILKPKLVTQIMLIMKKSNVVMIAAMNNQMMTNIVKTCFSSRMNVKGPLIAFVLRLIMMTNQKNLIPNLIRGKTNNFLTK